MFVTFSYSGIIPTRITTEFVVSEVHSLLSKTLIML